MYTKDQLNEMYKTLGKNIDISDELLEDGWIGIPQSILYQCILRDLLR